MIELVILPWIIAGIVGFIYYHLNKLSGQLNALKAANIEQNQIMSAIKGSLIELDTKMQAQEKILTNLKSGTRSGTANALQSDAIVNNYERAKGLIERGIPVSPSVLKNCNMTEEEIELLAFNQEHAELPSE